VKTLNNYISEKLILKKDMLSATDKIYKIFTQCIESDDWESAEDELNNLDINVSEKCKWDSKISAADSRKLKTNFGVTYYVKDYKHTALIRITFGYLGYEKAIMLNFIDDIFDANKQNGWYSGFHNLNDLLTHANISENKFKKFKEELITAFNAYKDTNYNIYVAKYEKTN
jgi:hypothetical protein